MTDLRTFLEQVRRQRRADVIDVQREVDPQHETAAILTRLEERGRTPLLHFHRVKGSEFPLVTNVCGSMGRLALALGCSLKDVTRVYGERAEQRVEPRVVEDAPCQEVVYRGAEVDLSRLPQLRYHEGDADAPYLTAAIVVARDPATSCANLSYHRLMIAGPRHTGIFIERGRHLDAIYRSYRESGRAMPVAVFIGVHPLCSLGALYAGALDVDEYAVIGGLLQHPFELVAALTQPDLYVPAGAELVLEGVVPPDETITEGPFGEFTGYGTGVTMTPVLHIEALTHRRGAIVQDVVSGRLEHLMLSLPALEHRVRRVAGSVAEVHDVALVAPLTVVVAIAKRSDDEPRRLIETLTRSDIYTKHVIVVDADVAPGDLRQVLAAVALQSQADRSVAILTGQQGSGLDPSCDDEDGLTSKLGIDATRPLRPRRHVTRNRIPAAVYDAVDVAEFLKR